MTIVAAPRASLQRLRGLRGEAFVTIRGDFARNERGPFAEDIPLRCGRRLGASGLWIAALGVTMTSSISTVFSKVLKASVTIACLSTLSGCWWGRREPRHDYDHHEEHHEEHHDDRHDEHR
jgi:hypothetical protein